MDIEEIHKLAIQKNEKMYIDPATGYRVFTSKELGKRPCCGNGCRHCPYGSIKGSNTYINK